jgi:glycosyltransferase involved in cell wall biosynthesis
VFNQENKGPGIARNTALDNAKGKYILFCDADDTLEPDACHECSLMMESNQVDIVLFNANIIEIDRKASNVPSANGEYFSIVRTDNAGAMNKIVFMKNMILSHIWQCSFSRDLINHYNLRFTKYKICEDQIFIHCYIMLINNGYLLKKTLYNYYAYKGSLAYVALNRHFWLSRFIQLPKVLWNCFKFAVKNKMPFKIIYSFYILFVWFKSRLNKR